MAPNRQPRSIARPSAPARPAPVRDFTGNAPRFAIEWDVRPAYDFLFSLSPDAGTTDDLPSEDRRWLRDATAAVIGQDPAVLRMHKADVGIHVGGYLVMHPELQHAADVVAAMRAEGPGPVLRWLFGEMAGSDPAMATTVDEALDGDATAVAALQDRLHGSKHQVWMDVLEDPEREFEAVIGMLERWAVPFAEIEPRVAAILKRDYDLRAGDRAAYSGSDLVERTTGGVRLVPEPGVSRVVLAPSYFSRPFNFILGGEDWRLAGYPVADAALELDPLAPPGSVLRLHRALGDETRLRILKLLADRDLYLTEIAELLELSKPTIKHHLAQLRVAGLVTMIESGSMTFYHLRRERLEEATSGLRSFLAN